jgi:hypothetical protein
MSSEGPVITVLFLFTGEYDFLAHEATLLLEESYGSLTAGHVRIKNTILYTFFSFNLIVVHVLWNGLWITLSVYVVICLFIYLSIYLSTCKIVIKCVVYNKLPVLVQFNLTAIRAWNWYFNQDFYVGIYKCCIKNSHDNTINNLILNNSNKQDSNIKLTKSLLIQ